MYFEYGMVYCNSIKHKLNTKISTEAEVVGVSDYLPYNIWIWLFIGAQGYDIKQNILFQDNQITIKIKKNGNNSFTCNSSHIDISYIFDKDRIESNKIPISYCSIEHMLADFLLKPYKEPHS